MFFQKGSEVDCKCVRDKETETQRTAILTIYILTMLCFHTQHPLYTSSDSRLAGGHPSFRYPPATRWCSMGLLNAIISSECKSVGLTITLWWHFGKVRELFPLVTGLLLSVSAYLKLMTDCYCCGCLRISFHNAEIVQVVNSRDLLPSINPSLSKVIM